MVSKERVLQFREKYRKYEHIAFFAGGFIFDVFTLKRVDDFLDLALQIGYISILSVLLYYEYQESLRIDGWQPPVVLRKIWKYQLDIVHFMFGGLFSAYIIFYFKSASASRALVFLVILGALLAMNEIPKVRGLGVRLRIGFLGFCATSFLIYFVPVLMGRISAGIFLLSILIAFLVYAFFVYILTFKENDVQKRVMRLLWPILVAQIFMVGCYFLKIIPPVPLSMNFGGIYHNVEKVGDEVKLYSERPWYKVWSHGDTKFLAREGDKIFCFVRIYAPAQFSHRIYLRWSLYDEHFKKYIQQDHIGMQVSGGREKGFRGFAFKSNFQPGDWRVAVETEDERIIGEMSFTVENDLSTDERIWRIEGG